MGKTFEQMSYSQQEEERYILDAVSEISKGRFLDIGAWDPKDKSNTRALYEKGWSGVLVEPSPKPLQNLLAEYGSDHRIQIVAALAGVNGDGLANMHVTDDALSTTEEQEYAKWKDGAKFIGVLIVPVVPVKQLIREFGMFDFVNIDTEGTSVDIFRELMMHMKPACVCVEFNDRRAEAMTAAGGYYDLIHDNGTNLVFKRRDS